MWECVPTLLALCFGRRSRNTSWPLPPVESAHVDPNANAKPHNSKAASQMVESAATAAAVATAAVCSAHSAAASTTGVVHPSREGGISKLLRHSNPAIRYFYHPPEDSEREGGGQSTTAANFQVATVSARCVPNQAATRSPVKVVSKQIGSCGGSSGFETGTCICGSGSNSSRRGHGGSGCGSGCGNGSSDFCGGGNGGRGGGGYGVLGGGGSNSGGGDRGDDQRSFFPASIGYAVGQAIDVEQPSALPSALAPAPADWVHPPMLGPSANLEPLEEVPTPPGSCGRSSLRPPAAHPSVLKRLPQEPNSQPNSRASSMTASEPASLVGLQQELHHTASHILQRLVLQKASTKRPASLGRAATPWVDDESSLPPRSESDGRSVLSDGESASAVSASAPFRAACAACRPNSPCSVSAKSEVSAKSSGTGTTATGCREALASLKLLAQSLSPGATLPPSAIPAAASMRAC